MKTAAAERLASRFLLGKMFKPKVKNLPKVDAEKEFDEVKAALLKQIPGLKNIKFPENLSAPTKVAKEAPKDLPPGLKAELKVAKEKTVQEISGIMKTKFPPLKKAFQKEALALAKQRDILLKQEKPTKRQKEVFISRVDAFDAEYHDRFYDLYFVSQAMIIEKAKKRRDDLYEKYKATPKWKFTKTLLLPLILPVALYKFLFSPMLAVRKLIKPTVKGLKKLT